MSQASDYLEGQLLDHIHGLATHSPIATGYIGLHQVNPADTGLGAEISGGSYSRLAITNDDTEWERTGRVVTNLNVHTFAAASANWGELTHWSYWDALTTGNMLIHGALTNPVTINNGQIFRIGAGKMTVTFNFRSNYLSEELLDHVFGLGSWSAPANMYLRLYTSNPTDAGGGTEVSTSGTDYAPIEILNDDTEWDRSSNVVSNLNDLTFAEAAAAYGLVRGRALWDASSAGNMLMWAPMVVNETIGIGDQARFLAGQLRQSLD